jgi:hypothetical protein
VSIEEIAILHKTEINKEVRMKKCLAVLAIVALFFIVFTAQSFAESEGPFEIGKEVAMSGSYEIIIWYKETTNSVSKFSITYDPEMKSVSFAEEPKSGTGLRVSWIKYFDGPQYINDALDMKDGEIVVPKTKEEFEESLKTRISITKDKAEKEAWRILQYFGYTKK